VAGKIQPSNCLGTQYLGPDKSPMHTAARLAKILTDLRSMAVKYHDARLEVACRGDYRNRDEATGRYTTCSCPVCRVVEKVRERCGGNTSQQEGRE
jgi:hypothetical protein